MLTTSLLYTLYTPVYIYALIIIFFISFLIYVKTDESNPAISSFVSNLRGNPLNFIFMAVLLVLAGTPPSIGFFAKVLSFYMFLKTSGIILFVALVLALVLIIYYTQSFRLSVIFKKKTLLRYKLRENVRMTGIFILFQFLIMLGLDIISILLDLLYSLFY